MFSFCCTDKATEANEQVVAEAETPCRLGVRTTADEPLKTDEALEELKKGNLRFVNGSTTRVAFAAAKRQALVDHGQRPLATVVGCADSRCPVEQLFDARPGDIFVLRNAGNTATHALGSMVGSVEYSVLHLKTKLVLVLGHTNCGAIMAATKGFLEKTAYQSLSGRRPTALSDTSTDVSTQEMEPKAPEQADVERLTALVAALMPVAETACNELKAAASMEEIAARAIKINVFRTINSLLCYSKAIRDHVASGEIQIQGGIYDMASGKVEFLGQSPKQDQFIFERQTSPGY